MQNLTILNRFIRKYFIYLAAVLVLVGIWATTLHSYILFHSIAELFSIVIAFGIFIVAWNARQFMNNSYLLFIGIAYLFVGSIDLVHTVAYKGMGVFPDSGSNLPTQLWIAARYLEAFSLAAAALLIGRKIKPGLVFGGFFIVSSLLLVSIFYWQNFPVCYIDGTGLTPFKKISEYVISGILLIGLVLLIRNRRVFDNSVMRLISASIVVTIFAELSFSSYIGVYDVANLIGHFLKIIAFFLIYKAIIETGISRPYSLLLRNLKQSEEKINLHAQKLALTNAELSSTNKELEAFNFSVSHDLRAPLRHIQGFSQMLAEDYGEKLDDQGKEYINNIQTSVKRMSGMIEDLLNLSRITRKELNREAVDLTEISGTIASTLQKTQPERQVEFRISDGLKAEADNGLIKTAMENLISNSWKYTAKHPRATIEVGAISQDGQTVYFVRDDGAGFDMTYADKLFGVFRRLHSDVDFPGTGIGLATVQRIIHRHGGKIWAEGQVEKGATFYFTLGN
jgi:signal transduction histidine kinase